MGFLSRIFSKKKSTEAANDLRALLFKSGGRGSMTHKEIADECDFLLRWCHADPNAVAGHDRSTPLHIAARMRQHRVIVSLVRRGAHVNAQDNGGCTALVEAAGHGEAASVRFLLAAGADPFLGYRNSKNEKQTPRLSAISDRDYMVWRKKDGAKIENYAEKISGYEEVISLLAAAEKTWSEKFDAAVQKGLPVAKDIQALPRITLRKGMHP